MFAHAYRDRDEPEGLLASPPEGFPLLIWTRAIVRSRERWSTPRAEVRRAIAAPGSGG